MAPAAAHFAGGSQSRCDQCSRAYEHSGWSSMTFLARAVRRTVPANNEGVLLSELRRKPGRYLGVQMHVVTSAFGHCRRSHEVVRRQAHSTCNMPSVMSVYGNASCIYFDKSPYFRRCQKARRQENDRLGNIIVLSRRRFVFEQLAIETGAYRVSTFRLWPCQQLRRTGSAAEPSPLSFAQQGMSSLSP